MTQASEELLRLAERCEKATGRDWQLEQDIAAAVGYADFQSQPFTSSLDAAMTLVPEGWRIAEVGETVVDCRDPWAVRLFERCKHDRDSQKMRGDASTFPLALCTAALRARAAQVDTHAERRACSTSRPARVGSAVGNADAPEPQSGGTNDTTK